MRTSKVVVSECMIDVVVVEREEEVALDRRAVAMALSECQDHVLASIGAS